MLYTRVLREFRKRENGLGEGRKCFVEEVEPEQPLVGGKQLLVWKQSFHVVPLPDGLSHPNLFFSTHSQHEWAGHAASQLLMLKNILPHIVCPFCHSCLMLSQILPTKGRVRLIRLFFKSQILLMQHRHMNVNLLHPFFLVPRWDQLEGRRDSSSFLRNNFAACNCLGVRQTWDRELNSGGKEWAWYGTSSVRSQGGRARWQGGRVLEENFAQLKKKNCGLYLGLGKEMEKNFLYLMRSYKLYKTQHPDCVVNTMVIPLWARETFHEPTCKSNHGFQHFLAK